jgi:transposase InsO family protein
MVGRILAKLKEHGVLAEAPHRDPWQRPRPFRRPHATRKPSDYVPRDPGDLVQIDSTDLRPLPGVILKHFTARDAVSRWDVVGVYHNAKAASSADLLHRLLAEAPYKLRAIQVDGGSEFKADFERLCAELGIQLFVLPPRSPKLNGSVERAQRTHKDEFYNVIDWPDSIADLRRQLHDHETIYNVVRPHQSLAYLTPLQFLQRHYKQKTDHDPVVVARLLSYTQHPSTQRRSV